MPSKENLAILKKALILTKNKIGKTYPNPVVGCILTDKNNKILSHGVTNIGGRPHAEIIAINKLKNKDDVENLYVTLEPCCHFGKTPPCIDEILKLQNLKNVFICTKDPNAKINGASIDILKKNNINVYEGFFKDDAIRLNQGFFSTQLINRPMISVKIATTLDGKIACANGESKWITNEESRQFVHKIRSQYDCILTTSKTILYDNPMLNVRHPRIAKIQPTRIIIDRNLNLLRNIEKLNLYTTANQQRTIILTLQEVDNISIENIAFIKLQSGNLECIFDAIKNLGITKVLVESGGEFITQLLIDNLIDKLYWFHSSSIIGNDGIAAINNLKCEKIDQLYNFKLENLKRFDDDILKILINEKNFSKIACYF